MMTLGQNDDFVELRRMPNESDSGLARKPMAKALTKQTVY